MKLVFALYKYFPYGGLQKDMLAIAHECAARGHQVSILCRSWAGEQPLSSGAKKISVNVLPVRAVTNQGKNTRFEALLEQALQQLKPDLVIGFNKIPGVDVYYAADTCFQAKLVRERPWLYRFLPRYRHHVHQEEALFGRQSQTQILAIAQPAIDEYCDFYHTDKKRFTLLPPGISRGHINASGERLHVLHKELALPDDHKIVLLVGSGFRTKGLDRAIAALSALPPNIKEKTQLVVAGQDNPQKFLQQAKNLGVEKQLHFLGGRNDVPQLLRSANVLIHPAYREAAGMVLLEAAISCLPVITTAACGYAHYIADNNLGLVLPSPFEQAQLNGALLLALTHTEKVTQWRNNGKVFAQQADIYSLPQKAADCIEQIASHRSRV